MAQVFSEISKDVESFKGRFGWHSIQGYHILYIIRVVNGEHLKFVSVRMAETQLLQSYLHYFNPEIYTCTSIKCYYMTNSEARLFDDINKNYCKNTYGEHKFIASKDTIVRLEDVLGFHKFLEVCYNKIHSNIDDHEIKFGFIRFNSNFVPYFTKDNEKYVPLLYFKGQTDDLLTQAVKLKNWNLVYIKFCFKIMGIFDHLYDSDSCTMVSLDNIKSYYPPETIFEDFWPSNLDNHSFLINLTKRNNQPGAWTTLHYEVKVVPVNTIPENLMRPEIPQSVTMMINAHPNNLTNHWHVLYILT